MWGFMRKLAIGAALSGALTLTGLAAPLASAADAPALTFSNVTVNKGKAIVAGTSGTVSVPVTYSLTRPKDLVIDQMKDMALVTLYRGTLRALENEVGPMDPPRCTTAVTTDTTVTENCFETITIEPRYDLFEAADAGTWKAAGVFFHNDGTATDDYMHHEADITMWGSLGTAQVKRAAKLTADATPEPAVAGRYLTVKGKLTRANWVNDTFAGYQGQAVALQFRADGTTAYKTLKTITSGTAGALSTTTKATKSGYYRFVSTGNAVTGSAVAPGDHVTVNPATTR